MLEKIGLPQKPSLRGNNWVADASHCQGCSAQFTFLNRKVTPILSHSWFGCLFLFVVMLEKGVVKCITFLQLERKTMISPIDVEFYMNISDISKPLKSHSFIHTRFIICRAYHYASWFMASVFWNFVCIYDLTVFMLG